MGIARRYYPTESIFTSLIVSSPLAIPSIKTVAPADAGCVRGSARRLMMIPLPEARTIVLLLLLLS